MKQLNTQRAGIPIGRSPRNPSPRNPSRPPEIGVWGGLGLAALILCCGLGASKAGAWQQDSTAPVEPQPLAFHADGVTSLTLEQKLAIKKIDPPEDGFFAKTIDYHGIPIKASAAVANAALYAAWRKMDSELCRNPAILRNLISAGCEMHVMGKNEKLRDLPESAGRTLDANARAIGGRVCTCAEENLLGLEGDPNAGRDLCAKEFFRTIFGYGISENVRLVLIADYNKAAAKGLWKGSAAGGSYNEYWPELTEWYFGSHGDMNITGAHPAAGPAWLKAYDPIGYAMLDRFFKGTMDVRPVAGTAIGRRSDTPTTTTTPGRRGRGLGRRGRRGGAAPTPIIRTAYEIGR